MATFVPDATPAHGSTTGPPAAAGVVWGEQHDRLLNFVFRTFDCCVRDRELACAMTVDLLGRNPHLVDDPDLDDDAIRAELVPLVAAALRERSSGTAIKVAVGHAAWQDRLGRTGAAGTAGWHAVFGSVRTFTRHLRRA